MDILCTLGNLHHCLALVECKTVKQRIDNYMYNIHNQTKFRLFLIYQYCQFQDIILEFSYMYFSIQTYID